MTFRPNENKQNLFILKSLRVEVRGWSKMESIPIDPLSHPKATDYMLTLKQKKKCLQFFRAKSELLDGIKSMFFVYCFVFLIVLYFSDLCGDIELWELFVTELNDVEKQIYTKTEFSNAIQSWKSSIISSIPTWVVTRINQKNANEFDESYFVEVIAATQMKMNNFDKFCVVRMHKWSSQQSVT